MSDRENAIQLTTRRTVGNPNPGMARTKFASAKKAFRKSVSTKDLEEIIAQVVEIAKGIDPDNGMKYPPADIVRAAEFLFDRMFGKSPINLNVNSTKKTVINVNIESFKKEFVDALAGASSGGLLGADGSSEPVHSSNPDDPAGKVPRASDR